MTEKKYKKIPRSQAIVPRFKEMTLDYEQLYSRPLDWCKAAKPNDTSHNWDLALYTKNHLILKVLHYGRQCRADGDPRRFRVVCKDVTAKSGTVYPMAHIECFKAGEK